LQHNQLPVERPAFIKGSLLRLESFNDDGAAFAGNNRKKK